MKLKRIKFGSVSALITVLVVIGAIFLNLIVSTLSDKYQLRFDLTSEKKFEISSESYIYLKNLQKDIKIDVMATQEQLKTNEFGIQVKEILNKYKNISSKINLDFIDLEKTPNYASKFAKENLEFLDIIISHNENYYILKYPELFETKPRASGGICVVSSEAEQKITSTIVNISEDKKPKVSFLKGYGEKETDGFESLLRKNGYEVLKTTISNQEISSDTNVLIIMAPSNDYERESIQKLEKFLENENNSIKNLIYVANPETKDLKNLESFIEKFGMRIKDGIVFENNPSFIGATKNPYSFFLSYVSKEYTKNLKSTNVNVYTEVSKGIQVENNSNTEVLLQSSKESGICPSDAPCDWKITSEKLIGPVPTAVCAKVGKKENDSIDKIYPKFIVFGTHMMFDENVLNSTKANNSEYILNVFKILTGNETSKISIEPKNMENKELGVTRFEANIIFFAFVVLIPLLMLVLCLAILLRRRNR